MHQIAFRMTDFSSTFKANHSAQSVENTNVSTELITSDRSFVWKTTNSKALRLNRQSASSPINGSKTDAGKKLTTLNNVWPKK
jgi:hypothetical protein